MYLKSNYFISAFQSCFSIQANSHLVNSPHFCQQSFQLTKPIFKFVNPVSNPPLLDIFPQSKNPWLSFRLRTRPQTTESLYLLAFLHSYLLTLDINTTVSTCGVCGNISTQHTFSATYPFISSNRKSCTKLLGLQET